MCKTVINAGISMFIIALQKSHSQSHNRSNTSVTRVSLVSNTIATPALKKSHSQSHNSNTSVTEALQNQTASFLKTSFNKYNKVSDVYISD
jgi:hypothetical protein